MKNKRLNIAFVLIFVAGILFAGLSYAVLTKTKPLINKIKSKVKERVIANIPKAKDPLVICDFENSADLDKWNASKASVEISEEHPTSGKYSAKLTYEPSGDSSSVRIEKYFEKDRRIVNWSGYEALVFDIYNPNKNAERMILQVRDNSGGKVKIDLHLRPNANNRIEVDIRSLWDKLNPSKIDQLNLFLWGNKSVKAFYLDSVMLLPAAALEKVAKSISDDEFIPKEGEQVYALGDYLEFNKARWGSCEDGVSVPIYINNFTTAKLNSTVVRGGVPFGRGQLNSLDKLMLNDGAGNNIEFQAQIVSKWPDGSIKWALISFKPEVDAATIKKYNLVYSNAISRKKQESALKVDEGLKNIAINTGKIKLVIPKSGFYLYDKLWLDKNNDKKFDDSEIVSSKASLVLERDGKKYYSHLDKNYRLTVEKSGPLEACIKAEGWFVADNGKKYCKFIVRIHAYELSGEIKLQHTFVYTGYPENKYHYLYKGKRLPRNETIDAVYIELPVKIDGDKAVTFAADDKIMQSAFGGAISFLQLKPDSYTVTGSGKPIGSGNRLEGWLDLSSDGYGVSIGVKDFWQQFPKGFSVDKEAGKLKIDLWPKEAGKLDLKTTQKAYGPDAVARGSAFGLAKTHDLAFNFHNGNYEVGEVKNKIRSLLSDVVITSDPIWVSDTRVLGRIWPYDTRFKSAESFLSKLFDWGSRQVDKFSWYGMIDFGDTLSWYRKEAYDKSYDDWGWHPEGRHGWFNCEGVGTHAGALIQFLRTGNYKYYIFGKNLSRHIMDIDTCHYNTVANDSRLRGRIPEDYSRPGSMHRHNADHWGGRNEETSHTNVYGLVLYYYLTGNERARDVIDEVGSFFLKEHMTYFGHPDISPQRSIANVIWGDVVLYELTGEKKYKEQADKLVNLFFRGQKYNGAWPENYNPVRKRWEGKPHLSFMSQYTIPALINYHMITGNKAIAGCIINATDFLIESDEYGAILDALSYSYWLTGDKKYKDTLNKKLDYTVRHQKASTDPLFDGMIYQKAYYARVMEYLYNLPFAFEGLAQDEKTGK
ncbi:MAG: hypothetical protein C4533_02970 [Candidatus Omnitrophota bacterium]|jgi:hypothetical protein|nr:MAG: hypothetical protein C4533_02970 [Candidatus Omnitrophota bacterium]